MDLRLVNREAVAHTPQPHIGEAYVGIKYSISTMYRGAVPITEHQPADVLEPLRGTGWRGYPDPTKALRSGRFACPALRAIVGLGGIRNRSAVLLYWFSLARRRHTGSCALENFCPGGRVRAFFGFLESFSGG